MIETQREIQSEPQVIDQDTANFLASYREITNALRNDTMLNDTDRKQFEELHGEMLVEMLFYMDFPEGTIS